MFLTNYVNTNSPLSQNYVNILFHSQIMAHQVQTTLCQHNKDAYLQNNVCTFHFHITKRFTQNETIVNLHRINCFENTKKTFSYIDNVSIPYPSTNYQCISTCHSLFIEISNFRRLIKYIYHRMVSLPKMFWNNLLGVLRHVQQLWPCCVDDRTGDSGSTTSFN